MRKRNDNECNISGLKRDDSLLDIGFNLFATDCLPSNSEATKTKSENVKFQGEERLHFGK